MRNPVTGVQESSDIAHIRALFSPVRPLSLLITSIAARQEFPGQAVVGLVGKMINTEQDLSAMFVSLMQTILKRGLLAIWLFSPDNPRKGSLSFSRYEFTS
jgi:hypothetical protein